MYLHFSADNLKIHIALEVLAAQSLMSRAADSGMNSSFSKLAKMQVHCFGISCFFPPKLDYLPCSKQALAQKV